MTRLNEDKALEAAMEMAIEYGFDGFLDDVYALINEAKNYNVFKPLRLKQLFLSR